MSIPRVWTTVQSPGIFYAIDDFSLRFCVSHWVSINHRRWVGRRFCGPWLAFLIARVMRTSVALLIACVRPPPIPRCPHARSEADGDLLKSLASRINSLKGDSVRLLVAEALVPGQTLQFIAPQPAVEMYYRRVPLAMVGRYRKLHSHGVGIAVETVTPLPSGEAEVTLRAGRLCEVTEFGLPQDVSSPWLGRDARVRYLSPDDDEAMYGSRGETRDSSPPVSSRLLARSDALEATFVEWVDKVRRTRRDKEAGLLDSIIARLGPLPDANRPTDRCLWVAGVINDRRVRGLANDVRPTVLMARSADARLDAVEMALADSLARLEVGWI
jgi:hypothetical protein